jgi:molybdopterin converting factor small subunit
MPNATVARKNLETARKKRAELLAKKKETEQKLKILDAVEILPTVAGKEPPRLLTPAVSESETSDEEELVLRKPKRKVAGKGSSNYERLITALEKLEMKLAKNDEVIQKAEEKVSDPKPKIDSQPVINIYNTVPQKQNDEKPARQILKF